EELLEEFLGIVSQERVRDFLKLLLNSEVDQALSFLRSIAERGFNLLRFWDSLEEELQSLLLYKSLKNPDLVIKVEDFHKEMSQVPLNALLYLEKVINATRVDARTRDFLKACELAVIKANIVKDIMSLSELASLLMAQPEKPQAQDTPKEQPKDPFEELRGKLDRLTFEALKRSKHELKEDKLIFYIKEGDLSREQIEKVKTLFPKVEFVVEAQEKKEEELPEFTKKVKDLFGAKIVSHERDKGKDTPS
ncbi:MAG: DNA polymerase III subunit gamma/tau, partial [Aquificota bacterium]